MVRLRTRKWLSPLLAILMVIPPLCFPIHEALAHGHDEHEASHCHDHGHEDHDAQSDPDSHGPTIDSVADLHLSVHECSLCVTSLRFSNDRALPSHADVMGSFGESLRLPSAPSLATSLFSVAPSVRGPPSLSPISLF